jgi:hypothetical protein
MHSSARTFVRFSLPSAPVALERAGTMVFVGLCKAALVLAALEASSEMLESNEEVSNCVSVELANLPQGPGSTRGVFLKRLSPHSARACLGVTGVCRERASLPTAPASGHRLDNGLRAPMQC